MIVRLPILILGMELMLLVLCLVMVHKEVMQVLFQLRNCISKQWKTMLQETCILRVSTLYSIQPTVMAQGHTPIHGVQCLQVIMENILLMQKM